MFGIARPELGRKENIVVNTSQHKASHQNSRNMYHLKYVEGRIADTEERFYIGVTKLGKLAMSHADDEARNIETF